MPLSAITFHRAYLRFQAIHRRRCGFSLSSFQDARSVLLQAEDYKEDVVREAVRRLDARRWSRTRIGDGTILRQVISAIEIPGNNLLQWQQRQGPGSEAHERLKRALGTASMRLGLEQLLYKLYRQGDDLGRVFDGLTAVCGRRYEVLAYLFFISDRHRFLPIRTRSFDRALSELGSDLRTQGQCNWTNYKAFMAVMHDVRHRLHAEGRVEASILDAHSFCWILARTPREPGHEDGRFSPELRQFTGSLQAATPPGELEPRVASEPVDMRRIMESRTALGRVAEELSLMAERQRLRDAGRPDLISRVQDVSDRPGLGYDIESVECDGTARFIEVKSVSGGNRFFLSEWEWQNSQARPNYWFYLVHAPGTRRPVVDMLAASRLRATHLLPIQFRVAFRRSRPADRTA